MSHYMLAIIHKPEQKIEDLLAPFDENKSVDPYIIYSRDEAIKRAREMDFKGTDDEAYAMMIDGRETDADGNIYSTYNPDSKWDWYEIGGRFKGHLKIKDAGCRADEARIKNVDFGIDQKVYDDALDFWDVVVDKTKKPTEGRDYMTIFKIEYFKKYYKDRETYARIMASFSTYAVITPDGEWHSAGEMGWFGCSSETPEEMADWYNNYMDRYIKSADPDDIITIVDLHI